MYAVLPDAYYEPLYEGAKDMLLVGNVDDRDFLTALFTAMEPELPEKKKLLPALIFTEIWLFFFNMTCKKLTIGSIITNRKKQAKGGSQ